jgi:hypothetical protein
MIGMGTRCADAEKDFRASSKRERKKPSKACLAEFATIIDSTINLAPAAGILKIARAARSLNYHKTLSTKHFIHIKVGVKA